MMPARRQSPPLLLLFLVLLVACGSPAATQQAALNTAATAPATETPAPPTATPGVAATATAIAPSATAAPPTVASAPTPTVALAPTPTITPNYMPPTPTGTRAAATGPTPAPASAVPAGWQVYRSKYLPIVVAYPPGWTYDDSAYKQGKWVINFKAPSGTPGDPYVTISSNGVVATTANIDVQRDNYAKLVTQSCAKSGVENTRNTTVSGIQFATVTATCDPGGGKELYLYDLSSGLNNNVFWYLQAGSNFGQFNANGTQYFLPMLQSLNIYANPPGVPPGGYRADLTTWPTNDDQRGGKSFVAGTTYHLQSTVADKAVERYKPNSNLLVFADFSLDVDVQQISGPANASAATYAGVLFRVQPQGADYRVGRRYLFYITPDGYYGLSLIGDDNSLTPLVAPTPTSAIHSRNATNHLTIVCQGAMMSLQINGSTVTTQRASIITAGDIGVYAATAPGAANVEYAFSNLQISEVP